jgi:mono/diheme cytochrome c family protein
VIDKVMNNVIDVNAKALDKARDVFVQADKDYSARAWIGVGVLAGAFVCMFVAGYLLRDFGKRNFEYFPDMGYSEAWESQVENDYRHKYADDTPALPAYIEKWGTAEMPPPDGTVFRGQQRLEIPAGDEGRVRAGRELMNPYADAKGEKLAAVLKRGKNLFKFNCQGCHGVDGVGNAPVTKYGVGAPTIANATIRDKHKDGEIFHIITHGFNTMPAHATHVDFDDRWKVIRYLRELQKDKK